ncbi:GNAT family N-acetyltransferase [Latilactobacillus graminis]|uniref:Acetyltransferase family protein n=2 Tax=Latilactobacillus graminis TaxID=60519 RepID=A0AA89I1Y5_9LACO|nr:GNAT family N-acetyltransferase [Latilactobacillus graminis]KRM24142.1 acetyltransferase family protein [Latilactobacillus graminis DSM 20719]
MQIKTEKNELRHFQATDEATVYQIGCNQEIVTQLNMPAFQSKQETQSFLGMLMADEDAWAIVDRITRAVKGLIMLAPTLGDDGQTLVAYELSFAILPAYQRQGIISAILPATLQAYAQTTGVKTYNAACFLTNQASQASLLKAQFTKTYQTQLPAYLGGQRVQYYRCIVSASKSIK